VGGQAQPGIYSGDLAFDFGHQGALPTQRDTFNFHLLGSVIATGSATGIVIDNDDPQGFSTSRFRLVPSDGRFYKSDYRYQVPRGWGVATYAFTGLDPNAMYRVSSHWYPWSNRSIVAPYTLNDGAGTSQTVRVNQRIAPEQHDSYFVDDQGVPWADVHTGFRPGSDGRLIVQLSGAPDGYVIADAVRVDKVVAAEIAVYEVLAAGGTRELVDGRGQVPFGFTEQGNPVAKTFQIRNVGTQPLTFDPPTLTLPDGYSLLSSSYSASAATVTLAAGQSHSFTLQLDADVDGAPEGTVSFVNSDGDESPFDFRVTGAVDVNIIDNNDAGFSHSGYQLVLHDSRFYLSDYHYEVPGGTDTATWTFTDLVPGNTYQLAATWYAWPNRATDATYIVSDSSGELGRVSVNQRLAPDGYADRDVCWEELVTVTLPTTSDGTVQVSLPGSTTGYAIADAVRIAAFHLPEILAEVDEAGSRQLLQPGYSTVDFGSALQLLTVAPKRIVLTNTGDLPLVLGNLLSTAAGDFPIVDDVPADNTYKFFNDQTQQWAASLVLHANQSDSFWVGQDTSNVSSGTLTGTVSLTTSDVDERKFEFGVSGAVVGNFRVIDNDSAGFSHGRLRLVPNDSRFYQQDYRYTLPNQTDQASWTFTNLAAGWYRVSATWFAWSNRATNLVYTASSTPVPAAADRPSGWTSSWQSWSSEPVDQRQAPSSGPGTIWEAIVRAGDTDGDSGVWVPNSGTLVVTLNTNSSTTGYAIADAVRVDFAPDLSPGGSLHAEMGRRDVGLGTGLPTRPLVWTEGLQGTSGDLTVTIGGSVRRPATTWGRPAVTGGLTTYGVSTALKAAVTQWQSTGISDAEMAQLSSVQVLAAHLPGTMLGWASATSPTIYVDFDAAGHGWKYEVQRAKGKGQSAEGSVGSLAAEAAFQYSNTPLLQHSITPILQHSITPILHYSNTPFSSGGMDLVTVVSHELGHVLGHDHGDGVMSATLGASDQLSVISDQSSVIGDQSSVISHQSSVISDQSSVIGYQTLQNTPARTPHPASRSSDSSLRIPHAELRIRDALFARLDESAAWVNDEPIDPNDSRCEVEDGLDLWGLLF
jgi:hypothetical protein